MKNTDNIPLYVEMLVRMGHSFQMEWLHPEYKNNKNLKDMFSALMKLILYYEGASDKLEEIIS